MDPGAIFEQLVEALPFGLYIVDRNRTIQFWNRNAELITGYLRHEVVGRRCSELLAHCDSDGNSCCTTTCPLQDTLRGAGQVELRVFAQHKDGNRNAVLVRCIPIRDESGTVVACAELFQQRHCDPEELCWIEGPAASTQGAALLSPQATAEHLRTVLAEATGATGVFVIEIEQLPELARQRGAEMAKAAQRVVLRTLAQVLSAPHDLGRWTRGRFLVVLQDCTEARFADVHKKLERVGGSCVVTWWGDRVSLKVLATGTLVNADDESSETLLQSFGAESELTDVGRE